MTTKISNHPYFKRGLLAGLAVLILVGLGVWHVSRHVSAAVSGAGDPGVAPVAGVAKVTREDLFKEVTIAAEFRPYLQAELNAKVSGYVGAMNVDIGDKVKAGQLLATIEVPELSAQLANAQAVEQKAEADYTNASLIYMRLVAVDREHPNLVAQQELDTAEANYHATGAAIAAARADVGKYQTLVNYTNIVAPFDGVVTLRSADPGQLVQAGTTGGQTRAMLRVSDNYRLRLDFPVTVDYVKDIQVGDSVAVRVESLDGKEFTGTISRFTGDVSEETRTMKTEIEVTNQDLQLMPGMYATVILKVEKRPGALAVPVGAVTVNGGQPPTVLVVNHDDQIEERKVTLGLEMPDKYEILSGLAEGDLVVVGNRAAFQAGQKVDPKLVEVSLR